MSEIDPLKLYAFPDAARLIPSHGGRPVCVETLRKWHKAGRFRAEARPGPNGGVRYFVWGSELLKLLPPVPPDASAIRSPAEKRRSHEKAAKSLEEWFAPKKRRKQRGSV